MGRGNQTFVPGSLPAGKRRKNGGDALRIKGRRLPGYYEDDGIRGRGDAMRSLKIPPCLGGSTGAVHQRPYLRASTAEVRRLHFPSSWQSSSRRRPTDDSLFFRCSAFPSTSRSPTPSDACDGSTDLGSSTQSQEISSGRRHVIDKISLQLSTVFSPLSMPNCLSRPWISSVTPAFLFIFFDFPRIRHTLSRLDRCLHFYSPKVRLGTADMSVLALGPVPAAFAVSA